MNNIKVLYRLKPVFNTKYLTTKDAQSHYHFLNQSYCRKQMCMKSAP